MQEELSRLEPIELRDIWPNEATDFTPWLAEEENLTLLAETLNMKLKLEAQEIKVGNFQADILCKNLTNNTRVLIENQLEETDHKHLGQILTYAAGLDAHTVIWIAKEFTEEHRAALDRLNEITNENFQYFGIELKVWQIGDSDRAPQFEIVSKPNDWNRTVSQVTEHAVRNDLSETHLQLERFWTGLHDYMIQIDSPVRCRKPPPDYFLGFSIGGTNFEMQARVTTTMKEIGVHLRIIKQNVEAHFNLLKQQRKEIEKELGETLEWHELPDSESCRISLLKKDTNPQNETDWPNQHEWLASKLELFDKVFRPRIKALDAADWEPPEDEDDA